MAITTPEEAAAMQAQADASAAWYKENVTDKKAAGTYYPTPAAAETYTVYDFTGMTAWERQNVTAPSREVSYSEYVSIMGRTPEQSEQYKHDIAFHTETVNPSALPADLRESYYGEARARTSDYYRQNPSPEFLAITSEYYSRRGGAPAELANPFPEDSAAGIAYLLGRSGGRTTTSLSGKAFAEGYSGQLVVVEGRNTVPTRDLSSGNLTGGKTLAAYPDRTVDVFMPYGEYTQIEVKDAKVLLSETGELGVYQKPYGHSQYMLVGGGGRAALQSGMFTIEQPETPYVVSQGAVGTYQRPSGKGLSRLGAEAYGGFVRPLDDRRLEPDDAFSVYGGQRNLANYVSPQGANKGKAELPGANAPWNLPAGSPAIQRMDQYGVIAGSAIPVPQFGSSGDRLVGGGMVAGDITRSGASTSGLPKPFISTSSPAATEETFTTRLQSGMRIAFSANPITLPFAFAADAAGAIVTGGKIPFQRTVESGDIVSGYETLNKELAPYTTDVSGIGKKLEAMPESGGGIPGQVLDFSKSVYVGASQHPVDIAATFAGGSALEYGFGAAKFGIAKAATSNIRGVSTAGKILSTPTAADIATVGKGLVGGYVIYESGKNIVEQPTALTKGSALGRTAIQFAGFGVGMGSVKLAEPVNDFAGKGYFSGKPQAGPIERLQFKSETFLRSLSTEQPTAYREVATIAQSGRFIEPVRKAEPDFAILSKSGEYAHEIKSALIEQPHSIIGSSSVIQQYPKSVSESAGLRIGKDVDAFVESPEKAIISLSEKSGLPLVRTAEGKLQTEPAVLDIHPIPQNYPGFKPSIEKETIAPDSSAFSRLFGDPYRKIAFPRGTSEIVKPGTKGYTGDLAYEQAQVQFGRKASGVSLFIQNPVKYGYRGEKDVYDFVTLYQAQRSVALSKGATEKSFASSDKAMASFMDRSFTYGTEKGQKPGEGTTVTRSVRDMFEKMKFESSEKKEKISMGGRLEEPMKLTFRSEVPKRGAVSSIIGSAPSPAPLGFPAIPYPVSSSKNSRGDSHISNPPSALSAIPSAMYTSGSDHRSSPSQYRNPSPSSPVLSSPMGSSYPKSPSPPSAPPSKSTIGSPPSVPPQYTPITTSRPPSPPPYSPPTTTSPPVVSPPTTVPPAHPPSPPTQPPAPPSTPPSSPPSPPTYPPTYPTPPTEPPTPMPPGFPLGGGGSSSGPGYRGMWTKTFTNPVGADILGAHRSMDFNPSRGMRFKGMKKFRMPKF